MNDKIDKIRGLETIKDFDFAVGGIEKDFLRVSEVPVDVTESDVNLIIFLLLEREFIAQRDSLDFKEANVEEYADTLDGSVLSRGNETGAEGCRTCTDGPPRNFVNQIGYGHSSRLKQSKKYAEELLQAVGITIPFQLLSSEERKGVFNLFSSSSSLLFRERYSSILDLYEALRRRSKFRESFEITNILGKGSFGEVFAVKTLHNRSSFAIKRIPITFEALADIKMILNESRILKKLSGHPNIARYHDSWLAMEFDEETDDDAMTFYLQMELCDGSLARWKSECPGEKLNEKLLLTLSRELADAVDWIHSHGFLHLDINPKNILWANAGRSSVKIVDFGLAVVGTSVNGRVGTVPYCPPENTLTAKSDIYSLGVTLFEISQNISTSSELYHRLHSKRISTGILVLDDVLPRMLSKHSHRPTASELKIQFDI